MKSVKGALHAERRKFMVLFDSGIYIVVTVCQFHGARHNVPIVTSLVTKRDNVRSAYISYCMRNYPANSYAV